MFWRFAVSLADKLYFLTNAMSRNKRFDSNTVEWHTPTYLLHVKQISMNALRELRTVPTIQVVEIARTLLEAILARVNQDTVEMEDLARVGIVCFQNCDLCNLEIQLRLFSRQ